MMTTVAKSRGLENSKPRVLRSNRGMATIETIPILIVFVMLAGYSLGMWGTVHSAILHSIAARTYAFETFRNRADLRVHRENLVEGTDALLTSVNYGVRIHGVRAEGKYNDTDFIATRRPLSIGLPQGPKKGSLDDHRDRVHTILPRNETVSVDPLWLMISYGICLDVTCGS